MTVTSGRGDGLEAGNLRLPREILSVLGLDVLEEVDGISRYVFDIILDFGKLCLYCKYLFVNDFGVEFGYFADRFLYKFQDVVHGNLPEEHVLVLLHLAEDGFCLRLP